MRMKGWHRGEETPYCDGTYICFIEYEQKNGDVYGAVKELYFGDWQWCMWVDCCKAYAPFHDVDDGKIIAWHTADWTESDFVNETENKGVGMMTVGIVLETAYSESTHIDLLDTETGEVLASYNERDSIPEWFNNVPVNKWDINCYMKEELQGGKVVYIPAPALSLYI